MYKEAMNMLDVVESLVVAVIEAFEKRKNSYFGGSYLQY